MSELRFQTAGETNGPSPTPHPGCAAAGGMCSGRILSSAPADFDIQMLLRKSHIETQTRWLSLPRCDDVKGSGKWRFLKNICGGNFLLCATNVPPEAQIMVPVKTQRLQCLVLPGLLTNSYICDVLPSLSCGAVEFTRPLMGNRTPGKTQ